MENSLKKKTFRILSIITIIVGSSLSLFYSEKAYAEWPSMNWLRSEILVHLGYSDYETEKLGQSNNDSAGQIGYDFKLGSDFKKFQPFLLASGYYVLGAGHTRIGIGSYVLLDNSEFQIDFSRTRETFSEVEGIDIFESDIVLYKVRLLWYLSLIEYSSARLGPLLGGGVNTHGEKKIFKFNRGEYYLVGVRYIKTNENDLDDQYISEVYWERERIKSGSLKQLRNSFVFRIGMRF